MLAAAWSCAFGQTAVDLRTQAKSVDFSGASYTKLFKAGLSLPAVCSVGESFFKTDAPAGSNLYLCTSQNTWTVQGGSGASLPTMAGNADKLLSNNGTIADWRSLGGDLTGPLPSVTVSGIQGRGVSSTAPATGQVMKWTGTQWAPSGEALTSIFGRTGAIGAQSGDYSFSQISGIAGLVQGGTGATTAAGALANLGAAALVHTHVLTDLSGISGKSGNAGVLQTFGGGTTHAGDCAQFDANGNLASTGTSCGGGSAQGNYSQSFTSQTSVTLAHNLGTTNVISQCYDSSGREVEYDAMSVLDNNTAMVTFTVPQTGRCVVNGTGGGSTMSAVNIGTGGTGVFSDINGSSMRFKSLKAGSAKTLVTDDTVNGTVDLDVAEGALTLGNLGGTLPVSKGGTGAGDMTSARANLGAAAVSHTHSSADITGKQGSGTTFMMFGGGSVNAGDCAAFDTNGNITSAGAPCGTGGGGGGTVSGITPGPGITIAGSSPATIGVDAAAVPTFLTGATALTFTTFTPNSCQEQQFSLPGAATQDGVAPGWPNSLSPGLTGLMYVAGVGNMIAVRICNSTASSILHATTTSDSANFRAVIIRSF
jgi:hypothetical protein